MATSTPVVRLHQVLSVDETSPIISPSPFTPTTPSLETTPITPSNVYEDTSVSSLHKTDLLASFSHIENNTRCSDSTSYQLEHHSKFNGGEVKCASVSGRRNCLTSDYDITGLIGSGQWCQMYCARSKHTSDRNDDLRHRSDSGVAVVKSSRRSSLPQNQALVAIKSPNSILARSVLESEAKILAYLSDLQGATDSIVGFRGFDSATWSLVLEYAPRTLETYCRPSGLDVTTLRQASQQLVRGISFLHAANIVHGDIKPSNILLRENMNTTSVQLIYCDFSSSCFDSPSSEMPESAGTYEYMAPEEFKVDSKSTKASDVYNLGMTLLTAASGRSIYADAPNKMILRAYAASGTPLDFVTGDVRLFRKLTNSGVYEALHCALTRTPERRISAEQWQGIIS